MDGNTWRTGDLRGDEGACNSVRGVVSYAWFALAVARGGESVLLFASGLCVTLAAGALSGAALGRLDLWAVAVFGAALCAAAWWREHKPKKDAVARTLDRRLRHQGALFTAYELEGRGDSGPLTRLLYARVLAKLRRGEARRAVRPSLALPVAAPLVAAALLALALEAVRPEPAGPPLSDVTGGLVDTLDRMRSEAVRTEGPYLRTAQELRALVADARELDRKIEELAGADRGEALRKVEDLDRRLCELEASAPRGGELRRDLAVSRSWLDSARQVLGGAAEGGAAHDSGPGEPRAGGAGGEGEASGLTAAGGNGTMSGSPAPGDAGSDPSGSPDPASGGVDELGTTAGAWWPAEYDEVVRRWTEARRQAGSKAQDG